MHKARSCFNHPSVGTLIPASPWIGSTKMAHVFLLIFFSNDSIDRQLSIYLQSQEADYSALLNPGVNGR